MTNVERWKKRIIEKFIERSAYERYYITDTSDILGSFGTIEYAANIAWEQLLSDGLLVSDQIAGRSAIFLNPNKQLEIIKYFNQEPVDEVRAMLEPPPATFKKLDRRFEIVTENAWPNQGTYYLCTQVGDPTFWVALFRSKPDKKPTRMNLGSIKNADSKLAKMWHIIYDLGKRETSFYKKQAEDLDQSAFGNNRQRGVAAFGIFQRLGWIKEVERHGKKIIYALDKTNLYDAFMKNQGRVCHTCARVCINGYCDDCQSNI